MSVTATDHSAALGSGRGTRHLSPTVEGGTIDSLTGIRGLAASWVVLYHFQAEWCVLFPWLRALDPLARRGTLAVELFFILSGFVLAYNYANRLRSPTRDSVLKFLYMRLARIYPVHLATLIAVLILVIGASASHRPITDAGYGARDFVLNILLLQAWVPHFKLNWNYPSWSVSCEWFAYLLFPLLCVVLARVKRVAGALIALLFALCFMEAIAMAPRSLPFHELLRLVGTFPAGCFAWRATSALRSQAIMPQRPSDMLALMIFLGICAGPFVFPESLAAPILLLLFAGIIFFLGAGFDRLLTFLSSSVAVYWGEVSYSLYMTHTIVQKLVHELLPTDAFSTRSTLIRAGILASHMALIALAAIISFHAIEQPARVWLRRRYERRHPG